MNGNQVRIYKCSRLLDLGVLSFSRVEKFSITKTGFSYLSILVYESHMDNRRGQFTKGESQPFISYRLGLAMSIQMKPILYLKHDKSNMRQT